MVLNGVGALQRELVSPVALKNFSRFAISRNSLNDDGSLVLAMNRSPSYDGGDNDRLLVYKTSDGTLKYEIDIHMFTYGDGYTRTQDICGTENDGYFMFFIYNRYSNTNSASGSDEDLPDQRYSFRIYKTSDGSKIADFSLPNNYSVDDVTVAITGNETVGATISIGYPSHGRGTSGDGVSEGQAYILCMAPDGTIDTSIMDGVRSSNGQLSGSGMGPT